MSRHPIPPVDWRRAIANPALRDEQSIMVNVGELRELIAQIPEPGTFAEHIEELRVGLADIRAQFAEALGLPAASPGD